MKEDLSSLFAIENIILESQSHSQDDAFSEFAEIAIKMKCIEKRNKKNLIEGFKHREAETSTGLEGGFAIPHARIKEIIRPGIIFVRYQQPLPWKTFDNSDVKVAIALLIPFDKSNEIHLQALSNIATKLLNQDICEKLKTENDKSKIYQLLVNDEKKTINDVNNNQDNKKGYIIGITACPAGVAHTYMAAERLTSYAKSLGYIVKIEKQGANGIEDKLTDDDIKNANVLIMATDIEAAEQERFTDIPILRVSVAEPLHHIESVINNAEKIMRSVNQQVFPTENKQKPKKDYSRKWFKLHFTHGVKSLKDAVLTGISYVVPVIVAGTAIQAIITIITQIVGADQIAIHANWLNTLSNVAGNTLSVLLAPILSAYIAYAMADKPGLTPGFLGGLACNYVTKTSADGTIIINGLGFLGGLIIGIITGYMMKLFKKYIVNRKIQGALTWFVYPVLGSLISISLILFLLGTPLAIIINDIFSGLTTLQGSNFAAIMGILIGLMCVFDLGGPFNKVAWAFSFASFSKAFVDGKIHDASLLVPYSCFWAAGIGTGWTTTIVTTIGRKFCNQYEREAGKMSWLLSSLGITEGSIPFALSDPIRVIPSFMIGGAISGGLCAWFGLGSPIAGGGFITMAGIMSCNGRWSIGIAILLWFIIAIIGALVSSVMILALKYIHTKPVLEKNFFQWSTNICSIGIFPLIKYLHNKRKNWLNNDKNLKINNKIKNNQKKILIRKKP